MLGDKCRLPIADIACVEVIMDAFKIHLTKSPNNLLQTDQITLYDEPEKQNRILSHDNFQGKL